MPKVVFVNEHRVVEVAAGKNLKELRRELGLDPRPGSFNSLTCGLFGACAGCQVWVRPDPGEPVPPLSTRDRLAGARGERRLSCTLTVLGNLEVTTMAGGRDRLRAPRPIAPAPRPTVDTDARRKPIDAAPSAEFVLGHPSAVGSGKREPPAPAVAPSPPPKPPAKPPDVAQ